VRIVPIEQVEEATTHPMLLVYCEIDPKREEERSSERARKGL